MGTVTTKDGTEIFYKDWGTGEPIFFHHGWPLSADDWDAQMMFFLGKGYRVIAHDRRGHGRSTQTATGHDMDIYADDAYEVVKELDLKDAVHIGHSTGGGEVTRYVARHGKGRVKKAVLISAIPPLFMKTDKNPDGVPKEVVDAFATAPQITVHSSTKISRYRSTVSIGPARRFPKELERIGGDRE
jgi:non-heme chloroperoxidase